MTISDKRVNAWADAYGVWHVTVEMPGAGNFAGAQHIARRELTEELAERGYLLQGIRLVSADHGAESTVFHYTESE